VNCGVSTHMTARAETTDHKGRAVRVGTRVRVLNLSSAFLDSLPATERRLVSEMVGATFEVDEIDETGQAWVTKFWNKGKGHIDGHGVGLAPSEMEVADAC
jgi:hypothetical protein